MGYSMGGRITGRLGRTQPARLRSAILGGIGIGLIEGGGSGENVRKRWKRRRWATSRVRWDAHPRLRGPTRSDRRHLPHACAARAADDAKRKPPASRCRF